MLFITLFLSLTSSLPLPSIPIARPFIPSDLSASSSATPVSKRKINTGTIPTSWRHTHGTMPVPSESSFTPMATTTPAAINISANFVTSASTTSTATNASGFAAMGDMILQATRNSYHKFCMVSPWICDYCIPGEETHLKEGAHKRAKRTAFGKDRPDNDDYKMGDCIPRFSWRC